MSFHIIGTGSAVPENIVTNADLAKIIDTSDEWITTRTGIKERRICTSENITDLAVSAARSALENANVSASELDMILCSTVCGEFFTPSLACCVQKQIGAPCMAFDINAACTGFIYALDIAATYFDAGKANKILIIAAETMSKLLNWEDRATCVLFGDGAGAVVLEKGDGLLSIKLSARGNTDHLKISTRTMHSPFDTREVKDSYLSMNGQEVYKFAVSVFCKDLLDVITLANLSEDDIDFVLPHQANMRIIEAAKDRLNIKSENYLSNMAKYGNMSSASIVVLLDEANRENRFQNGDLLALAAFGGGFTNGACIIRWGK